MVMDEKENTRISIEKGGRDWKNIKNITYVILSPIILVYLVLGIAFFVIAIYCNYYEIFGGELIAFVVLATSIVGAAYLFVTTYIENQLGIKEKEMLKEYSDKIEEIKKEVKKDVAEQLAEQTTQQRMVFAELLNELVKKGEISVNLNQE